MGEDIFVTLRVYREDKIAVEKLYSKDKNFAEIFHELVEMRRKEI